MSTRNTRTRLRWALLALGPLSLHCGTSTSSVGGADASTDEGSSGGSGSSSSGGGVDAASEAGEVPPADGSLDDRTGGDSGGGDAAGLASCLGSVRFRLVAGASAARYCENMPCEWPNLVTVFALGGKALTTSPN